MWVEDSAPSNIALIKYMGKLDSVSNKPTNTSFSMTLDDLKSFVRIKADPTLNSDQWSAYVRSDLRPIEISEIGKKKFLNHFNYLKNEFNLKGYYHIESANNFPSDCGLASSASSFAALTKASYKLATQLSRIDYSNQQLSLLSRKGSGSSCRSFYTPWSVWSNDTASEINLPLKNLKHMVILCDENIKKVSSSQAHLKVLTSDLFSGRIQRAEKRFADLVEILNTTITTESWKKAFHIVWNEFWDMHNLFHTSSPPFMYINGNAQFCLEQILQLWESGSGPLVTMDAGSNIHLLFKADQSALYHQYQNHFGKKFNLWTHQGYLKNES
jgi:diphosphomevalonate decarboxylase